MVYKMDISAITALNNVNGTATVSPTSLTGMLAEKEKKAEGTMFETFLNTAIDNVKTTNSYLSDAENEKIRAEKKDYEDFGDYQYRSAKRLRK